MRISEIYLAKVFDRDGTELGRVDDVRFSVVAARPADAYAAIAPDAELWPFGKVRHRFGGPVTYKLTGFVCSSGPALGHRLGYGAGPLPGPWLVRSLLALLRSRTAVVEWSDVNHVDSAGGAPAPDRCGTGNRAMIGQHGDNSTASQGRPSGSRRRAADCAAAPFVPRVLAVTQ